MCYYGLTKDCEVLFMNLGNKIKTARENAGLTQEELGKKCSTTKQTIYKYETGVVTNIPLDRLQKIADVLDVSAAFLLGWEEEQPADLGELSDSEVAIIKILRKLPAELQGSFPDRLEATLRDQGLL
jgi:transcriptional regulator with XRE-family HTH domain